MQTRRDFCKNLLAAGIASTSLSAFAKSYCGVDFGKGGDWVSESVMCYFSKGLYNIAETKLSPEIRIPQELFQRQLIACASLPKVDFNVRAPIKFHHLSESKPREKSKREKLEEEYKMIWFEEASEFENNTKKGMKNDKTF